MKKKILINLILILSFGYSYAQTKVSGYVFDKANEPVAFATILFKGSIEGTITDENILLNSTNNPSQITLLAPTEKPYYEYSVGIGNVFKILRLDVNFRGNYLDNQGARKLGVTFTTGFNF